MPGDWNAPVNTTAYASVLSSLDAKDRDALTLCDAGDPSNIPTGAKKWNTGTNRLQRWNGAAWVDLAVDLGGGGTGATSAAGARTNLGLGDMATQSSAAVNITGGTIAGATVRAQDIISGGKVTQVALGTGSDGSGQHFLADDQTYKVSVPVGGGALWFTNVAPTGWLVCDGSSLDRTTYAALFAIIGTIYGSVDGTHFTLPDLRQRFPLGKAAAGTGNTLAGTGGAIDHTHTSAGHTHTYTQVPNHVHPITDPGHTHAWPVFVDSSFAAFTAAGSGAGGDNVGNSGSFSSTTGIIVNNPTGGVATGTTASTTPGATGTNNPPYLVINYIIKYQ